MSTPEQPALLTIDFPLTVDLSAGPVSVDFNVTIATHGIGVPIGELIMEFDNGFSYSTPLAPVQAGSSISAGNPDGAGRGATADTFSDSTPDRARATITLDPSTSPGTYKLVQATLLYDERKEGDHTFYSAVPYRADTLEALRIAPGFTVVNSKAPAVPTATIEGSSPGFSTDGMVRFAGNAVPGARVEVGGVHTNANYYLSFGSTIADAGGKWALTTSTLNDGRFSVVTARAVDHAGNGSAASAPLAFEVAKRAPDTYGIGLGRDAAGHVNGNQPLIWGIATPGRVVSVYDGAMLLGTTTTTAVGDWWFVAPALANGVHAITSRVSDPAGRVSADSRVEIVVDGPARKGIAFSVASFDNRTSTTLDAPTVQRALDRVGLLLSDVLDGVKTIPLEVQVMAMQTALAAAAGTLPETPVGGLDDVDAGVLHISPDLAAVLADPARTLSRMVIDTLVHEMLHVLGFNQRMDYATDTVAPFGPYTFMYNKFVTVIGNTSYFTGPNAMAIHGGPVPIDHEWAHLAIGNDIMGTGASEVPPLESLVANRLAPLSALDIAILKDLGYTNRDPIVAADGHTFLPGNGQPGHDRIVGRDGIDRMVLTAPRAHYTIEHTDAGATTVGKIDAGGAITLAGIERIVFNDAAVALDIDGNAGQAYRLYQAAFGREPEQGGIGYWMARMAQGTSLHAVAGDFLRSDEFMQRHGQLAANDGFVTALYRQVLNRAPEQAGLDYWLQAMASNIDRAEVLVLFSESQENRAQVIGIIEDGFDYLPYSG